MPAHTPDDLLESLREEVVWEADRQTLRFLYVSAGAERMFGYAMSEWETDKASFWAAHLHPDDLERCRRAFDEETAAGRDHELEYRMRRADGSIAWVRDRVYLVRDAAGAVVVLRGIMTDITERHRAERALTESEDRLRLALDAARLGIWDYSTATGELLCSERCYELLAAPPGSMSTYAAYLDRVHPDDRERVLLAGTEAFRVGAELAIEYRVILPDGGERWILSRGKSYADRAGQPVRFIGTMVDISERVRSQEEMERLLEQLRAEKRRAEQASRTKDEFLAMLGHELRNPLAPIKTALEVMSLRQTGRPSREEQVIRRQVDHLIRLLDDLLDVSRITSGQVRLDRRPIDLADVIAHAIETTSPLFEQRRHHLSVQMPPGRLSVFGDEVRLTQAVANLLDNAARYTPAGGRVRVSARRGDGRAIIDVADSGVGIDPELLPRVFELFVQAERAPDRAEGGLGIGLSMVRTLVGMHGGEVSVRSQVGAGTRVEVRLPLLPATAEKPHERAEAPARARIPDRQSSILVVDDNQDAADLLAEVLRGHGHEVRVAHDGPQALERLSEFRPQVAILDIGLPVMDGYELARALRDRLGSAVRLLAVTGYGQERDRARSHEVGFEKHFVKPVALSDLIAAIDVD